MLNNKNSTTMKKKQKTKELGVIRIETMFFITPMFSAPVMSLYLKPLFVLVRSFDGAILFGNPDINVVKNYALAVGIKNENVSII